MQDTVRRIAQSYDSLAKSIGASDDHSALLAKFDKLQITINQHAPRVADFTRLLPKASWVSITIGTGTDSFDVPILIRRAR